MANASVTDPNVAALSNASTRLQAALGAIFTVADRPDIAADDNGTLYCATYALEDAKRQIDETLTRLGQSAR